MRGTAQFPCSSLALMRDGTPGVGGLLSLPLPLRRQSLPRLPGFSSSITHNDARHAALAAPTGSFPPVNLDDCPTLHSGYPGGGCVAQLQTDLNIAQGSHLVVDGSFGPVGSRTYNAVIAFQGAHGLPQNGIVGPDMKKALKAALSGSSVSRPRP